MTLPRYKTLTIRTPEGISFPLVLASPLSRFLALAVDTACITLATTLVRAVIQIAGLLGPDLATGVAMVASFVVSLGYPIVLEWYWRGQTLGKRLFRLQVMDAQGLRLQFTQVVIRNLLRVVDALPVAYLVGGLAAFFSARGQRLGDLVANTIVIRHPRVAEPDIDRTLTGKYNSFRDYPHLAARLRQNVSPQEAGVALQALLRRDTLGPEARLELFADVRAYMHAIVPFPPEATDGLSDEHYVRNVVDLLYRGNLAAPPT
ncbi:MAG: RDD family protein [Kiritimatiellae bacterium]|nr:RDD family protein [Kiritimatiellia bacterium]